MAEEKDYYQEVLKRLAEKRKRVKNNKEELRKIKNERKKIYYSKRNLKDIEVDVWVPKKKYEKFVKKARKECVAPFPLYEVVQLLLDYYLRGEFIISRRLIKLDDDPDKKPVRRIDSIAIRRADRKDKMTRGRFWVPRKLYRQVQKKLRKDRLSFVMLFQNLMDFYLKHRFAIKTKVVRASILTSKPLEKLEEGWLPTIKPENAVPEEPYTNKVYLSSRSEKYLDKRKDQC